MPDLCARVARITAACHRRLGARLAPDELDDVRQDVLIALWSRAVRGAAQPTTDGWIYGAARIQILNHLRRVQRRREEPFGSDFVEPEGHEPQPGCAPGTDFRARFEEVLSSLGSMTRGILVGRFLEGRSFGTVALLLGASEASVRARWLRRLPSLRTRMRGLWASLGE